MQLTCQTLTFFEGGDFLSEPQLDVKILGPAVDAAEDYTGLSLNYDPFEPTLIRCES